MDLSRSEAAAQGHCDRSGQRRHSADSGGGPHRHNPRRHDGVSEIPACRDETRECRRTDWDVPLGRCDAHHESEHTHQQTSRHLPRSAKSQLRRLRDDRRSDGYGRAWVSNRWQQRRSIVECLECVTREERVSEGTLAPSSRSPPSCVRVPRSHTALMFACIRRLMAYAHAILRSGCLVVELVHGAPIAAVAGETGVVPRVRTRFGGCKRRFWIRSCSMAVQTKDPQSIIGIPSDSDNRLPVLRSFRSVRRSRGTQEPRSAFRFRQCGCYDGQRPHKFKGDWRSQP